MQPVPRIFVSATSRDLRTARGLVAEGLRRMECLPIVQDDFPPDYKSVRDMLRTKILTCNAVVHLAGFYYGAEPQPVIPGPDRRSFTQMEYEIAMELKLPCYVFLCGENFPFDKHDPEPEEKRQLQMEHRARLLQRDELFYEFASPEELANRTRELQLSVENLRKELAKERSRRRVAMGLAAGALVVAVGGGIWMRGRQKEQEIVNVQQSSEIAALKAQLEGPFVIVTKVNAAMEIVAKDGKATPDEQKKIAIGMVAAELKKKPEDIQKAIDETTNLAGKLIAAARAEGEKDASKRDENRKLEAETLRKLAASHEAAGKYADALKAAQEGLALLDQAKEPKEWLDGVMSVARMERALGHEAEALAKYKEAMEFGEATKAIGVGDELTIDASRQYRSLTLYGRRDVVAAEALSRHIYETRKSALGPEAGPTIEAMADVAEVLAEERKLDEAGELVLKAWNLAEKVFGKEDPVTIQVIESAAGILEEKGKLDNAINLQRRAVAYFEKQYGEADRRARTRNSILAGMLEKKEEFEEAEKIYRRNAKFAEEVSGAEHRDTLWATELLASVLNREKQSDEAEKLLTRVIETRKRVQGPDHPETISSISRMGSFLIANDDWAGAEPIFREVYASSSKTLGSEHASTTGAAWRLMLSLKNQKKYAEAEKYARIVLAAREKKSVGANDPKVADSYYDLSCILEALDKKDEAIQAAKKALAIAEASLPEGDDDRKSYASQLKALLNPSEAKRSHAADAEKVPSLQEFSAMRKKINDEIKAQGLKDVTVNLAGAKEGHDYYATGTADSKYLLKVMLVDAADDKNGTWTFFYWQEGKLMSVFRVREGSAVPVKDVAKATDTYNFYNGKMVSWKRTQDDIEKVEDPEDPDFEERGKKVMDDSEAVSAPVMKKLNSQ